MEYPIEVEIIEGDLASFEWNGREYHVFDVLHSWESTEGSWWSIGGRERRRHYRVQAGWHRHRITAEIYLSSSGKSDQETHWVLSRVYR